MAVQSRQHSTPAVSRSVGDALSWQVVIDALPAITVVLDREGQIIGVNAAWRRFATETGGQLTTCEVGTSYLEVCGCLLGSEAADARRVVEGVRSVLAGQAATFRFEYPCHTKAEQRWFVLTAAPLPSGDGAVVSHTDISQRREAEWQSARLTLQLAGERARLRDLLANVPGMVWEAVGRLGQGQRVTLVSRYAEQLLGHGVDHWQATPDVWLQVVAEPDRERVATAMAAVMSDGQPRTIEFRCAHSDGRAVWVETAMAGFEAADGSGPGVRGVTMDISERKRYEETLRNRADELVRMARQLQTINEELDQFAYITSHDLKAPLRGIANLSRWIEEDMGERITPQAHEQMELLRGRVNRMESLITGLLQYSRVGRVRTHVERVDVNRLLAEVIDMLSPPPTFQVQVEGPMPIVFGERLRLQQVFMNLIGNAIKHHDRADGLVTVAVEDAGAFWRFSVSDDGPGIAPRFHGKIFVIFQTLVPRDQREAAGVGLSLVKKIVEDQGGSIDVESREGAGARFTFTWAKNRAEQ